ncbi:MAG: protein kinase [Phycisphaerales bacterium]|nr:protein kinase [Phycisphaerales bacterium]
MVLPKAGDRVNNYLLETQVGAGSFGQVWRARHHVLEEVVAIKILTDPQYVRNFRQEGVVVHGLRHPNIVRVFDIDPYADMPYLVMEYVDGQSLRSVIDAHPQGIGVDLAVRVLRGVLSGLQAAHEGGLVHRDVKPANIMLRMPDGALAHVNEGDVKLTDFGLGRATAVTTASLVQSGSLVTEEGKNIAGTLVYMSPEQRAGAELDGRSDLYSCAVVFFEMLTGQKPAGSDLPSMIRTDVPANLDEIFRNSYTRLERRFASASAMLAALGGAARHVRPSKAVIQPVEARSIGGTPLLCPGCHQGVRPDDNFCIHCGNQLVDAVPRCPSCKAFANRADRFCIFCGTRLAAVG